jgi:hypothetical protein
MQRISVTLMAVLIFITTSSCQKTGFLTRYGIFHVENSTTASMNGTIGARSEKHFQNMMKNNPNIKLIVLEDCPGSKNDEVNLKLAKRIHDAGINTQLKSHSEIASGAVDLFLAGVERTMESGAKIGVHSWSGDGMEASELPESSTEHLLYINFYKSVGMTDQESRDFYFFTINAAKADDIHWMTAEEIELYNMITR